jgi:hypothetical protein
VPVTYQPPPPPSPPPEPPPPPEKPEEPDEAGHRTGKGALRLHVQKNALLFFSALYSIGSNVLTLCNPKTAGA